MRVETFPAIDNYDHLPPTPLIYGFSIITSSIFFFLLINYYVKLLTASGSGADDTWKWRNLFISWLHALIVGTLDLWSFYLFPEMIVDLIAYNNMYIYALVAFSTGYFLYDFIDIARNGRLKKMWEVIPHHIAVAGTFTYNIVASRCVAYTVVALLSEVNTIFLHSRKLLQMHKCPFDHWIYRLNALLNLVTFVCCRFLCNAWITYGMFSTRQRVSIFYFWILAAAMFVMWVTNVMLFWRLVQSDVIRPYVTSRRKKRGVQSSPGGVAQVSNEGKDDDDLCSADDKVIGGYRINDVRNGVKVDDGVLGRVIRRDSGEDGERELRWRLRGESNDRQDVLKSGGGGGDDDDDGDEDEGGDNDDSKISNLIDTYNNKNYSHIMKNNNNNNTQNSYNNNNGDDDNDGDNDDDDINNLPINNNNNNNNNKIKNNNIFDNDAKRSNGFINNNNNNNNLNNHHHKNNNNNSKVGDKDAKSHINGYRKNQQQQ